jgi:hypothetical protein
MTIPTMDKMIEIQKLAVSVVLAADLSGKSDEFVAQAYFLELPSDHFLLREPSARYEFRAMLKKQRAGLEREKQAMR